MQVARQQAEERLQEAETAVLSHQLTMSQLQQQSQAAVSTQPRAQDSGPSETEAESQNCTHGSAESSSKPEEIWQEETATELLPNGTTLQLTNPLFSQQGTEVLQNPVQMPDAAESPSPSMAGSANSQQNCASQSVNFDHARNSSMAGLAEGSSATSVQQLQQQVQGLRSELDSQALQLQTSEAGKEYIQRLLNVVTAEHSDLKNLLEGKQVLKQTASNLKQNSSFLTGSAGAKVDMAEPVPQGLLGLQPATSQIPAMWLTTPGVRRSLLTEYGPAGKPYGGDGPTLEGAESIMGPRAAELYWHASREADSTLSEVSLSGQSVSILQHNYAIHPLVHSPLFPVSSHLFPPSPPLHGLPTLHAQPPSPISPLPCLVQRPPPSPPSTPGPSSLTNCWGACRGSI